MGLHQSKNKQINKTDSRQGIAHKARLTHKAHQKHRPFRQTKFKKPLQTDAHVKGKDSSKTSSLAQAAKNIPKKMSGKLQEKLAQRLIARTKQKKVHLNVQQAKQNADELEKYKKQLAQYKNDFLYLKAEFDNYKKRISSERVDLLKYRSEKLATEILEVVDTFERALSFKMDPQNIGNFVKGMKMVYSAFITTLKKEGIEDVRVLGKHFDPQVCDALSQEATSDYSPGHVCQVIKKPYKLHDKVIRFGQVVVAQKPQASSNTPAKEQNKK